MSKKVIIPKNLFMYNLYSSLNPFFSELDFSNELPKAIFWSNPTLSYDTFH